MRHASVEVPLTEKGGRYFVDATFGTGEKAARQVLLLSLNAPVTWVPGVECAACEPLPAVAGKFNSTASDTFRDQRADFADAMGYEYDSMWGRVGRDFVEITKMKYGGTSWYRSWSGHMKIRPSEDAMGYEYDSMWGRVGRDFVEMPRSTPTPPPSTSISTSLTFGVVNQTSARGSPFFGNGASGILGFALNSSRTLLSELGAVVSRPVLALDLQREPPSLRLGGVDATRFQQMDFFPVLPNPLEVDQAADADGATKYDNWRLASSGNFKCNGQAFASESSKSFGVLLTTSLDVIAVPDQELVAFVAKHLQKFVQKTNEGMYLLNPGAELALDVCFDMASTTAEMKQKCYLLRTEDLIEKTPLGDMLLLVPHSLMRPGFALGKSGWILGTRFLRKFYAAFEFPKILLRTAPRVGLALPKVGGKK
eukprot:g15920.t1